MLQQFSFHFALRKGHPLQRNAHKLEVLEIRQPLCPCTDWSAGLRSKLNPFVQILGCVGDSTYPVGTQQPVELIGKGESQCKANLPGYSLCLEVLNSPLRFFPIAALVGLTASLKAFLYRSQRKNGMARANKPVGLTASAPHWYCAT